MTASSPGFVPGEQVGIVQCAREAGGETPETARRHRRLRRRRGGLRHRRRRRRGDRTVHACSACSPRRSRAPSTAPPRRTAAWSPWAPSTTTTAPAASASPSWRVGEPIDDPDAHGDAGERAGRRRHRPRRGRRLHLRGVRPAGRCARRPGRLLGDWRRAHAPRRRRAGRGHGRGQRRRIGRVHRAGGGSVRPLRGDVPVWRFLPGIDRRHLRRLRGQPVHAAAATHCGRVTAAGPARVHRRRRGPTPPAVAVDPARRAGTGRHGRGPRRRVRRRGPVLRRSCA